MCVCVCVCSCVCACLFVLTNSVETAWRGQSSGLLCPHESQPVLGLWQEPSSHMSRLCTIPTQARLRGQARSNVPHLSPPLSPLSGMADEPPPVQGNSNRRSVSTLRPSAKDAYMLFQVHPTGGAIHSFS